MAGRTASWLWSTCALRAGEARLAIAQAPGYPPNRLCLAEALVATEDPERGRREYESAAKLARKWLDRGAPDAGEWLEEAERNLGR